MKFSFLPISGALLIEIEPRIDDRGFFARTWSEREFRAHSLVAHLAEISTSFNPQKGTMRGMHYQTKPYEETKLVRCTNGSIYDVILDLRPESCTFRQWFAVELNSRNRIAMYVPTGVAHGYQTLENDTEVLYQISETYHPECARGVRWDDPAFNIQWPAADRRIISVADRAYEDFRV